MLTLGMRMNVKADKKMQSSLEGNKSLHCYDRKIPSIVLQFQKKHKLALPLEHSEKII